MVARESEEFSAGGADSTDALSPEGPDHAVSGYSYSF